MRYCLDLNTKVLEGKQFASKIEEGVPKDKVRFFDIKSMGDQD